MKFSGSAKFLVGLVLLAFFLWGQATFSEAFADQSSTHHQLLADRPTATGAAVPDPNPSPAITPVPNPGLSHSSIQTAAGASTCDASLDDWQRHVIEADRPSGESVYSFALDINDDGWIDVLSGAHWYENPKTGISSSWTRHDIGSGIQDLVAYYDFDGDGDLDLLGVSGGNWPLVWAENDGNGNFTIHTNIESGITVPLPDPVQGVAITHFTEDGPLEVAITWDDTEEPHKNPHGIQMITVPEDPVNETWTRRKLSDFSRGEELSPYDIDQDGDIDLYIGNYWLRNEHPDSTWTVLQIFTPDSGHADRSFILDVDRDGDMDTLDSYSHDPEGKVAWYEQPDDDPFDTWTEHLMFQGNHWPGVNSLNIADMDNDGDIDAVAGEHSWSGDISVLRTVVLENLDGLGGSWQTHIIYVGDEAHVGMGIADFDLDGDYDVSSVGYTHERVHIYENKSDHECGTPIPTATPVPTWTPVYTPTPTPTPMETTIPLAAGWSMISSNVMPSDADLDSLLLDISSNMMLLKNSVGQIYWPDFGIDNIGSWDILAGYQIYMNSADSLIISGTQVEANQTPLELVEGYNLISYLPLTALPIEYALNGVSDALLLVKNGDGDLYWPDFGINQIGDMQPGEGYLIYMTGARSLTYPEN